MEKRGSIPPILFTWMDENEKESWTRSFSCLIWQRLGMEALTNYIKEIVNVFSLPKNGWPERIILIAIFFSSLPYWKMFYSLFQPSPFLIFLLLVVLTSYLLGKYLYQNIGKVLSST